jgi:Zn-dependent protease with chaperone function
MSFEPYVIESIARHKRRAFLIRLSVVGPLVAGCLAFLAIVVIKTAQGASPADVFSPAGGNKYLYYFLLVTASPLVFELAIFTDVTREKRRSFLKREVDPGDSGAFARFQSALCTVSIAAGLAPARLGLFDLPTPNSFAFVDREGRASAGVTLEALELDLNLAETEAMMAHHVAHIMEGDCLEPPAFFSRGLLPIHLYFLLVVLGVTAAGLALPADWFRGTTSNAWLCGIAMLIITTAALVVISLTLQAAGYQDDILADSIAVKLTGDPQAMTAAVERVDEEVNRPGAMLPVDMLVIDYMFVNPRPEAREYDRMLEEHQAGEGGGTQMRRGRDKQMLLATMREFSKGQRTLMSARMNNLELIKRGTWQAFDGG